MGLWAAAGTFLLPVLKKHKDGFPDAINDHVLRKRIKTFAKARSAPKVGDDEEIFVLPSPAFPPHNSGRREPTRWKVDDGSLPISGRDPGIPFGQSFRPSQVVDGIVCPMASGLSSSLPWP